MSINKGMARGIAWMSGARFAVKALGLVSTLVLVRLLDPRDFGIIAMGSVLIAFATVVRAFNFDSALIHEAEIRREDYDTAWTLNVLLGVAIGTLLAAAAPAVALFYADPRITGVLLVLAVGFAVEGFVNTGVVQFRKEMNFRVDFQLMVLQKLVGFVATLILAVLLRNYWALALGTLINSCAGVGLSYVLHPFRPRFSLAARERLLGFSKWLLLSNLIGFLRDRTPYILLGKLDGPVGAGTFSVAYETANLATSEVVAPINRAVLPGYVKLAENPEELRAGFSVILGFITLVALPAALGIGAVSDHLVAVLLGPKWLSTARLIEVLAIAAALNVMLTNSAPLLVAVGKPKLVTALSVTHGVALLPVLVVGILKFGAPGAAWGYLLHAALVVVPTTFGFIVFGTAVRLKDIGGAVWRPVTAGVVMYCAVRAVENVLPWSSGITQIVSLGASVLSGAAIYVTGVLALWRLSGSPAGAEAIIMSYARAGIRRLPQLLAATAGGAPLRYRKSDKT